MIKLCPQWHLRSMKEHLPALVLGRFLLSFGFICLFFKWTDWKSSETQRDPWLYFRCAPQFYLLMFHQIWRTQSSSELTAHLQLTSSDLHYLEMCSKVMSHSPPPLPRANGSPSALSSLPRFPQRSRNWHMKSYRSADHPIFWNSDGCSAPLNCRLNFKLHLKLEHPILGSTFKHVPCLLSIPWWRLW